MDIFDVFVDMQATGDRIKQLRKELHMRVFDLANALELESEQAIYKWQRGQCLPNADNLVRLSILFGCHIDDILVHNMTGEDESPLLPLYEEFGRTWRLYARSFFQLHGECNLRLTSLEWLYRQ